MKFERLLIANRGEIAVRLIRAAREVGLETVAVYSEADRGALHVLQADLAVCIGPAPATESYLNAAAILEAARKTGAAAIHPGYGFLSENAAFAEAVVAAGLTWVGPPAGAMRLLGDKSSSRALAKKLGVPTVPGDDSEMERTDRSADPADGAHANAALAARAETVGFPLLLKPVAGGGGKGMHRVNGAAELPDAIRTARREAFHAFGDSRLLLERFVAPAHHVEIQIFADAQGHVIHLGERECSIQRRHQKIIEESPSPTIEPALREQLADAAVTLARAAAYRSAGTCEFLIDEANHFYFLEVNTRLQVEHPVTELVTGFDLARMQLIEATGRELWVGQSVVQWRGHALEARLYAEDPERGFLPSAGRILFWKEPEGPGVRVDSGIATGLQVGVHYDPILAKIIVHDFTRNRAVNRLRRALAETVLLGLPTNLPFLRAVVDHPEFQAGRTPVDFIARHFPDWQAPSAEPGAEVLALAAMAEFSRLGLVDGGQAAAGGAGQPADAGTEPNSPWRTLGGFRMEAGVAKLERRYVVGGAPKAITAEIVGEELRLSIDGVARAFTIVPGADGMFVLMEGHTVHAGYAVAGPEAVWVQLDGRTWVLPAEKKSRGRAGAAGSIDGTVTSPMTGTVQSVFVTPGAVVVVGTPILIVEAMKMEYTLAAPISGTVVQLAAAPGQPVDLGAVLLVIEPPPVAPSAPAGATPPAESHG